MTPTDLAEQRAAAEERRARRVRTLESIVMESGVSATTGEPFVTIRATAEDGSVMVGQLDPDAIDRHAVGYAQAAEAARHDASLFAVLRSAELDERVIGHIMHEVRSKRAER